MALVTPQNYSLTPDISPLAENLRLMLSDRRKRDDKIAAEQAKAKALADKTKAEQIGAQAMHLRAMGEDSKTPEDRQSAYNRKRAEIIRRAVQAYEAGDDKQAKLWESGLEAKSFDEMNTWLIGVGIKGGDAGKFIDDRLKPFGDSSEGGLASAITELYPESGITVQTVPTHRGQPAKIVVKDINDNILTGQAAQDALKMANEEKQKRLQRESERTVQTASQSERAKLREKRYSKMQETISTRVREFARSLPRLNQALTLASDATQGIVGSAKVKLSRLLPGIDVTNEAALEQSLRQLTLDQLAAFKGPTTDFEYNIAESTVGTVGDNKTANIARLKSLKRANWFIQREFEQLKRFKKLGGDPDLFKFNFFEQIETKRGPFPLQDLQDTAVEHNLTIEEVIGMLNQEPEE